MCVVSNVGDDWSRRVLPPQWPSTIPYPTPTSPAIDPDIFEKKVSRREFEELKRQVERMREELEAAREIDEAAGNEDCEMDDKVKIVKEIARLVGVDLGKVFPHE